MGFYSFKCKYCGEILPVELKDDNKKMVKAWCYKCGRWTYINNLEVVKDYSKPRL